jgi:hypothetical protein
MTFRSLLLAAASAFSVLPAAAADTALVLFETKPEVAERREGIAFLDVDPRSASYGTVVGEIPLPPDTVGHHIFEHPSADKAYVTSLGRSELTVLHTESLPYRLTTVSVPDCKVLEDVAFSEALGRWYLTCMGTSVIIVGDSDTDRPIETIRLPEPWPHGITVRDDIDRILVTSTVDPADPTKAGETVTVLKASTGEVLSVHKMSEAASPSGAAPVEVFFVPKSEPPVAYVTNLGSGTLWLAEWTPETESFAFREVFDFKTLGQGMPLEVYFDAGAERAFVTTASPGHVNAFDIRDPRAPKHVAAAETAPGAHHMLLTEDGNTAYVQNGLMNLPGINDGSISVVDLRTMTKTGSIDVFKAAGQTVNVIVPLPGSGNGHTH